MKQYAPEESVNTDPATLKLLSKRVIFTPARAESPVPSPFKSTVTVPQIDPTVPVGWKFEGEEVTAGGDDVRSQHRRIRGRRLTGCGGRSESHDNENIIKIVAACDVNDFNLAGISSVTIAQC